MSPNLSLKSYLKNGPARLVPVKNARRIEIVYIETSEGDLIIIDREVLRIQQRRRSYDAFAEARNWARANRVSTGIVRISGVVFTALSTSGSVNVGYSKPTST